MSGRITTLPSLIKPNTIEYRKYQVSIAKHASQVNTLVVLPTGLGKSIIAALTIAYRLERFPESSVLFLAPTRPLALQHYSFLKKIMLLNDYTLQIWTGSIPPSKRVFKKKSIVVGTPQALLNDVIAQRIPLQEFSLLILDEVHRCVGNYPYTQLSSLYLQLSHYPLILGLTASIKPERERLERICELLKIRNIEYRDEESPDVSPYVHKVHFILKPIDLPYPLKECRRLLLSLMQEHLNKVYKLGVISSKPRTYRELEALINLLRKKVALNPSDRNLSDALKSLASIRRISIAIERLDFGGASLFLNFMQTLFVKSERPGTPKALKMLLRDQRMIDAIQLAKIIDSGGGGNPKLPVLLNILETELKKGSKGVIVFTSFRYTSAEILNYLQKNSEVIKPIRLIGQSKRQNDKGFSQKKQWEAVSSFKSGFRNVLIATQVGEEGLDITSTDAVVFFDNTSSAIRFIQRKGRTGRIKTGKVYILYYRNTRDESYLWAAMRKEKKLKKFLREISSAGGSSTYPSLLEFTSLHKKEFSSEVKIIIDYRELKSQVASELKKLGVALIPTNLSIGDYIISEKVCIERKTAGDFSKSIVDNRLFDQIRALKSAYESPILLIEGESLYLTGVDAKAVRGALITIAVDYGLPILWSRSAIETALLLKRMAIREQREKGVRVRIRAEKKPPTLYEQQLYLVSGLPGIERKLAERLLRKFSTPQKVFTASQQELVEVEGIGKQKANQIRKTLTTPFKPESNSN